MSIGLQAYSPCACPMIAPEKAPARVPKFLASALPIPHRWTSVPVDPHFPLAPPPPKVRCFWSLSVMLVWFWVGRKWEVGRWEGKKVSAAHNHVNEKSLRSLADMAWPSGWSAHLGSATVLLWYLSFVPTTCTYLTPKPPVPSLWVACPERRRNGLGGLNFLEFVKPWSRPVSI